MTSGAHTRTGCAMAGVSDVTVQDVGTSQAQQIARMADVPGADDRDPSILVWVEQDAAPMPPSPARRWADLISTEHLFMAYGMTEALGTSASRGDEWMRHQGSVGRGMRGTEVRILDSDGCELPPGGGRDGTDRPPEDRRHHRARAARP